MAYGIERLNCYAGRLRLSIRELALARGLDCDYVARRLLCDERSVYPPIEDAVTLAVNAAQPLLTAQDRERIELLITATESGVDFGKPVASWVHRLCGLAPACRTLEVKNACYGCTGALKLALAWLASGAAPGAKALVIGTDLSRIGLSVPAEPIAGGCAVALLVSAEPEIAEVELADCGYWAREIADTFRPTASEECINDQASLGSYLDALEGSFEEFRRRRNGRPLPHFAAHLYHAPFPGMTRLAHRTLWPLLEEPGHAEETFRAKVEPGLRLARRIGTCYGSSNFVSLAGLLSGPAGAALCGAREAAGELEEDCCAMASAAPAAVAGRVEVRTEERIGTANPGPFRQAAPGHAGIDSDRTEPQEAPHGGSPISVFSYGSGCQGEFYTMRIGPRAARLVRGLEWEHRLEGRRRLGLEEYERIERARAAAIEQRDFKPWSLDEGGRWEEAYRGSGLLVLEEVSRYERSYGWR